MQVGWEGLRLTEGGRAAARLTISEGGNTVMYNVYLQNDVQLIFQSADRSRVDLAASLLRRVGVGAEVKKMGGVWYVRVYTDMLAAGRKELRRALVEIVREAAARGWVGEKRAEKWLKKLERGNASREGWPKYLVRLTRSGSLEVRFGFTNPDSITREVQKLKEIGLKESRHFTVKRPEGGNNGYVRILREGLARVAQLSVYGGEESRRLATEFVEYIPERAKKAGGAVYEKVREIVEEGKARGWAAEDTR
jgi:hypothetical protein